MNLFYRRPLSIILCIMLGGFSLFPFLTPILKALFASSALILVLVFSFFSVSKHKITFGAICSSLFLLSVLLSLFYFDFYAKPSERFEERVNITGKISSATLIDEEENLYSYTIKTTEIDSNPFSFYSLYFKSTNEELSVGTVVTISGKIESSTELDKEMESYYFSLGQMGTIDAITNIAVKYQGLKPISYYTEKIRASLTEYLIKISNDSTGTMLSALLFGERQALSPNVKASFTSIGISHILALSGMHVALLCLAVNRLLMLLRVKRSARTVTTISLCTVYMIITGMSVSVVRASLMMIISLSLSLLFKSSDSITSLILSVFIIVLFAPYSVYSVSLWLSAFATLGVILSLDFTDVIPYKNSIPRKLLRYLFTSVLSSVFALSSTMLISSYIFGTFSPISLISTLVFTPIIELIMLIGAFMMVFGWVIPISFILSPIVSFTEHLAESFSALDLSVISTNLYINIFLAITSAVLVLLFIAKTKSKKMLLSTVICLHLVSVLPIVVYGAVSLNESNLYYKSVEDEDFIIVKDETACHVISYGNAYKNNAYEIYEQMLKENIHKIDTYVIFDLSENTENELNSLLSRVKINRVLLPSPKSDMSDYAKLYDGVSEYLEAKEVELISFGDEAYTAERFSFLPIIYKNAYDTDCHTAYFVSFGGKRVLYLSSGIMSGDYERIVIELLPYADVLLLGDAGGSYSKNYYFNTYFENLSQIVFSGEGIYLTPELATKYEENGCKLSSHPSSFVLFN